jgi:hypothetical protein
MVWTDMQLGPVGTVRPDVYTIDKSYVHPHPVAYEIKVSLSDFATDVTAGKWQSYLKYATGVYFACEAGLIHKDEVPTHCGLYTLKDGRWRAAKRAVLSPVVIPQDALLKLLIDGVNREGPTNIRHKQWDGYAYIKNVAKQHGELVAKAIRDHESVQHEVGAAKRSAEYVVKSAEERAVRIRKEAADAIAPARQELCAALGLTGDADIYRIKAAVHLIKEQQKQHPAVAQLQNVAHALRHALAQIEVSNDIMEKDQ